MADPVFVVGTPLNPTNMNKLQTRDEKDAPSGYVGLNASSQTSSLTSSGYVAANPAGAGSIAFATNVPGDTVNRWTVNNQGALNWSSGSSAADVTLYRNAAADLKTDGSFTAAQHLIVDASNGGNKIYLSTFYDTYLQRSGAGVLAATFGALGLRDIVYGAADSGGSGYRLVRIAN